MRSLIYILLLLITKSIVIAAQSEYFSNPSFEGPIGQNLMPNGWTTCNPNSNPDTQPGSWNVTLTPSDGLSYIGLFMSDSTIGDSPRKNEDVQTKLNYPLYKNKEYKISIDLAAALNAIDQKPDNSDVEHLNNPSRLRISGGKTNCQVNEIYAVSALITNTNWQRFTFEITPKIDTCLYLKLEIYLDTFKLAYLLLDNIEISDCNPPEINGKNSVCQGQMNVSYIAQPANLLTSYNWHYTGSGVLYNNNDSNLLIDFNNYATNGNIILNVEKTGCDTVMPAILPIKVKPLPADAYYIIGDSNLCNNHRNLFYAQIIKNAISYNWNYTGTGDSIVPFNDSMYISFTNNATNGDLTVMGKNECGTGNPSPQKSLLLHSCYQYLPYDFNIPNAFTPNGDGINDFFVIRSLPLNSKLIIFNRFGETEFESDNYQNDWNGCDKNGKILANETYWYILTIPDISKEFKGFVYIKR
jgi:gliding motility-associated-like protein